LGGVTLHDLKQENMPALAGFDCVVIGSSLYAGAIRKEAKVFLVQNTGNLQGKAIGLFLSGMDKNGNEKYFADNFPTDVLQAAKATSFLGGVFDPKKANAMERLIMKAVTKQSEYVNTISDEKIKQFAQRLIA